MGEGVGVLMSDVQPRKVKWLWPGRIPLAKLTMLDGDPDVGKSALTLDLASRVSTGRTMPDGTDGVSGGVLLIFSEDDVADTVRPRLEAMGADLRRIKAISVKKNDDERLVQIPGDEHLILKEAERLGAMLIVVDPLNAFLNNAYDQNKDKDIRHALWPIQQIAERSGASVVAVRHLNKQAGTKALYRGSGSIAYIGVARSGLLAAKIPGCDDCCLTRLKCNLAKKVPSLKYRLEESPSGSVVVIWDGEIEMSADELLNDHFPKASKRKDAKELIKQKLSGGAMPSKQLEDSIVATGISKKTYERARDELGVECVQTAQGWISYLPDSQMVRTSDGQAPTMSPLTAPTWDEIGGNL